MTSAWMTVRAAACGVPATRRCSSSTIRGSTSTATTLLARSSSFMVRLPVPEGRVDGWGGPGWGGVGGGGGRGWARGFAGAAPAASHEKKKPDLARFPGRRPWA